jgi:hypothetical protein
MGAWSSQHLQQLSFEEWSDVENVATQYIPKVVWMIITQYYYHSEPNMFDPDRHISIPNTRPGIIDPKGHQVTFNESGSESGYALCRYPFCRYPLLSFSPTFSVLFHAEHWTIGLKRMTGKYVSFCNLGIFGPYHHIDFHDEYAFYKMQTMRTNHCLVKMKCNFVTGELSFMIDEHDLGIAPITLPPRPIDYYPYIHISKGTATIVASE